ncbi:ANTAR domain-containing response regulator [Desulforamulus hydrothermalis]|uniref:Stage 0 sporulation protein A homolog n=1 Tax=Desulforamulus hydrothermalis Lam5 = DSM 18033 TaxID=1121428 RepID=K8DYR2_9FIRM|nr:ANTAR domain-containing protein [Desulforamulus hydrothermalis]CCO08024.1 Response regulator receiver and ANTAR domain protein [Desulforamulus hydrothermalis Lam5 = DSM 18033]SHG83894.1 response regulator receiver and ANTAR domain protein [Desulforamulus hydrothermalis Lam5 = DSM 18033]
MANPRIVIVDADEAWCKHIKTLLGKLGCLVVGDASDGPGALQLVRNRHPDLLIIQDCLQGISGLEVARIMYEDQLGPVILTTDYLRQDTIEKAREARVFSILQKPVEEHALWPAVELALANYQEIVKLEKQLKDLRDTLETRKLVEKAKGILMQTMKLSEEEAYKRMQRQSMNKRISMRAVAEAIILAHSIK